MAQSDRVVILGGAGFIGRHLARVLAEEVDRVRVVSRTSGGIAAGGNIEYLTGDVGSAQRMDEVIAGSSVVYQLTIENDYEAGARNVAEACVKHGVRRLIFASTSDALYLGSRGIIYETDGPDPRPELRNEYSRGKTQSEHLLLRYFREHGLGVVIVRPALVVGPGGRLAHGGVGRWVSPTCCLGWGNGKNPMPFVLVQDVAQGLKLAMDAPGIEGQAFNLAGDVFLSTREYVEILARETRRNFRFRPQNLELRYAYIALKGILLRLASGRKPADTYRDMKSSGMFRQIDNGRSKQLLGWKPNASREVFIEQAIRCHIQPFHPGDLRLENVSRE